MVKVSSATGEEIKPRDVMTVIGNSSTVNPHKYNLGLIVRVQSVVDNNDTPVSCQTAKGAIMPQWLNPIDILHVKLERVDEYE